MVLDFFDHLEQEDDGEYGNLKLNPFPDPLTTQFSTHFHVKAAVLNRKFCIDGAIDAYRFLKENSSLQ